MITDQQPTGFLQTVSSAIVRLKQQLQREYEKTYPELREIIHLVLDEEESRAWGLTLFPHLLLPDLVEAHIARLNLQPIETTRADVFRRRRPEEIGTCQPAFAMCG